LSLLLSILLTQIAPIFLAAGSGFAVGRTLHVDVKSISRITLYIFSPCLVFVSLTESQLSGDELGRMAAFTAAAVILFGLTSWLFGRVLRLNRHTLTGLMIVCMFGNGGNYGLALNKFAFGDTAVARAVVYYVVSTLFVYTAGIFIASSGRAAWRESLLGVFKVPVIYGLLLAVLLRLTGWELPLAILRPVKLLSEAAIPVMLVVLGLQLAEAKRPENLRLVTAASAFQLISGPVIGLTLAALLGLSGPARQAAVVEASMPTAVITTILAVEYNIDPVFVTGVVVVTTLLSPLTLTPLIAFLQR
jgi:predicted permease